MAEQKKQSEYKWLVRILFLLVIIIEALFVFIWTGTMRCRSIPGGCNIYWSVMTLVTGKQQPSVLILYDPTDQKGLGNPELLKDLLTDRKGVAIHPTLADIRYLNSEQLKNVSLVIVEKSRKISTLQLMTMLNYISQGGRLVWIGDAGVDQNCDGQIAWTERNRVELPFNIIFIDNVGVCCEPSYDIYISGQFIWIDQQP